MYHTEHKTNFNFFTGRKIEICLSRIVEPHLYFSSVFGSDFERNKRRLKRKMKKGGGGGGGWGCSETNG